MNRNVPTEERQTVILRNLPEELARTLIRVAEERVISPDELAQQIIIDHVLSHDGR